MAPVSQVQLDAMNTAAQQIDEKVGAFQAQRALLDTYGQNAQAQWKGMAASAFATAQASFDKDFVAVINALSSIYDALTQTHKTYSTNEDTNTAVVNKVASALSGGN